MKKIFELTENSYGSLQWEINTSYKNLCKILWEPNSEWDWYKISTEWIVKYLPKNIDFTIYDYKETDLYDNEYPDEIIYFLTK